MSEIIAKLNHSTKCSRLIDIKQGIDTRHFHDCSLTRERVMPSGCWIYWLFFGAFLLLDGCQSLDCSPVDQVNEQLQTRNHSLLLDPKPCGELTLPPGASLEHALTEDEAISIALWNNPLFQETLMDLHLARSDLIQAGLLPNPEFVYYFGVSDKPFKYLFDFSIEALWLRPIRLDIAQHEQNRVVERLTQTALDLIRDVRTTYADVLLAMERKKVAEESLKLRQTVAELAFKRLKAGEISEQEAATARIDALQAEQDLARINLELPIAQVRLKNVLGVASWPHSLTLDPAVLPSVTNWNMDALEQEALNNRPDVLAARESVAAAEIRAKLAKVSWFRFLGILDATSGENGHEFGPAARLTLPIFNQNQGAIARADAELEKARRAQLTLANQITLEVRRAGLQYQQVRAELDVLQKKIRPEVESSIKRAQAAYLEGNISIFIVLETTRQLLDSFLREAQLTTDVRRTWAELERSVGKKLTSATSR